MNAFVLEQAFAPHALSGRGRIAGFKAEIMRKTVAAWWIIVLVLIAGNVSAVREFACIRCHEFMGGELARPVAEWTGSIHEQNGITCALCHGGNPDVPLGNIKELSPDEFADRQSRSMSRAHGFVAKPSGKAMFDMCARCHPASVDRYARSIMGKAYLDNTGGPSCTLCHNAHNNTMPQVPEVCTKCHKDTSGFDQIDPMNVTEATVTALSGIRIKLEQKKAVGDQPPFIPEFPEDLEAFQIGFVAFGAVIGLFIFGYIIYRTIERRK